MIQFLKDWMSSISSDLYEEILKPNKSHTNCIIKIVLCKTALIQFEKDLYRRIYKRERFVYTCSQLHNFCSYISMRCDFVYNTIVSLPCDVILFTIRLLLQCNDTMLMSLIILFSSSVSHFLCWHDVLLNWWTIIRRL